MGIYRRSRRATYQIAVVASVASLLREGEAEECLSRWCDTPRERGDLPRLVRPSMVTRKVAVELDITLWMRLGEAASWRKPLGSMNAHSLCTAILTKDQMT